MSIPGTEPVFIESSEGIIVINPGPAPERDFDANPHLPPPVEE